MASNNPNNPRNNPIAGALTYPAGSRDNAPPLPVQPRRPRNYQGLLRFAMEATKAEDAPGNSNFGPMDAERRRFLEEALNSLTVNVAEILQNAIKVLTNKERMYGFQPGEALPDDVKNAFTVISDYIDDIDIANDFYKVGGFAIFPVCYGCENEEIRANACNILAELCQNNPFCQARSLECGLLSILLMLVQREKGDALIKCMYAISCSTRGYQPACRELIAQGACGTFVELLGASEPPVRTKAMFLVRYLCQEYPESKEQFVHKNIVREIAEHIQAGRDGTTEHLLHILLSLIDSTDPIVLRQCRHPSVNLKYILENHLKHPDLADDTYEEEKEFCQELLDRIFLNYPTDLAEEEVDR